MSSAILALSESYVHVWKHAIYITNSESLVVYNTTCVSLVFCCDRYKHVAG